MNMIDHNSYFFIALSCGFLVLERLVHIVFDFSRWMKRRAVYKSDVEYAELRRIDEPQWEEFLS